jgi:6-phosphofructokinase 1
MGRSSGWIAVYSAISGGATEVLVPERDTDIDELSKRIRQAFEMGKGFCLIVVAEGDDAGGAFGVARKLGTQLTGLSHRVTTLGHVQRGGAPSMRDRILAAKLGDAAVTALLEGHDRIMVGEVHRDVIHTPLEQAWTVGDKTPQDILDLMGRLAR